MTGAPGSRFAAPPGIKVRGAPEGCPGLGGEASGGDPTPNTLGLAAGVRPGVMMDLMGHSSPTILRRYESVVNVLKREAAVQFDRLLGSARL